MSGSLGEANLARMARSGLAPLSVEDALAQFDSTLSAGQVHLLPMALDIAALRERAEASALPAIFRGLVRAFERRVFTARTRTAQPAAVESATSALPQRLAGLDAEERRRYLVELVRADVATVLAHPSPQTIDPEQLFNELGFDSLTAVELWNRLSATVGVQLPATLIFDYPTVNALVEFIHDEVLPVQPSVIDQAKKEIERLERLLSGSGVREDDETRAWFEESLRGLLMKVAGDVHDADALDAASDSEIFAFIDELRRGGSPDAS
jgi:acyl carrier protein